ncbi:MAG TPA: radical SAM protein [Myxococcota bacterium]|nr:radical SAM protein [Myxococcota bacterium]HQK50608.1 radical SAM protein [Myxococcota bacterium]
MNGSFLRVPVGSRAEALWPADIDRLPPKVYLVPDDPVRQEAVIVPLLEWLAPHRRIGLVVAHPPRIDPDLLRRLIRAGLRVIQWRLATPLPERYDRAFGATGALDDALAWLDRCRLDLAGLDPDGQGRQFSPLRLEAWVPIEPRGLAHGGSLARAVRLLGPRVQSLELSLWSARDAAGGLRLPPFPVVAREVLAAIEAYRTLDAGPGLAEFHLDGESGLPLCLLPDEASRVFLHPRPSPGDDGRPRLALCAPCRGAEVCDAACRGPWRRQVPPDWEPHLHPLSDGVPQWLLPRPDNEGYQDRDRPLLHQPRNQFLPSDRWRDRRWRSDLGVSTGASRVSLGLADRPARRPPSRPFEVLLVRLPVLEESDRQGLDWLPPLSLILLGSMLREAAFPVTTLDLAAEAHRAGLEASSQASLAPVQAFCRDRLREVLGRRGDVALVGFSLDDPLALPLATGLFEDLGKTVFRVLGGRGVRNGPRILAASPMVDAIVEGEGEVPLVLLAQRLAEGRPLDGIPGLVHRQGGAILVHPSAEHALDLVAPPDLSDLDFTLYPRARFPFQGQKVAPSMFVHGCPYHCAFCADYTNGRMRMRDPDRVVDHLARMVETSDCRNFVFLNTLINANPQYLDALTDRLRGARLPIRWVDSAKPRNLSREQLQRLREAGCEVLIWGIDAASRRMNRRMTKGFDLDEATRILQWTHEAGIRSVVNLIAGLPGETDEDVEEALDWIARHRPFVGHLNIMPYRFDSNSRIHLNPERFGIRITADGRGYSEDGGREWPEVQARIRQAQQRYQQAACHWDYCNGVSGEPYRQ